MRIQTDEEGKKAIESIIETGMRRGAWGKDDLLPLATIQQIMTLIEEPNNDNG